jgi:hypothetical protein
MSRCFGSEAEAAMGRAVYTIVGREGAWSVEHEGETGMSYQSKEAAFEAAVAPASNSLHEGHEVIIRVPGKQAPDEPWLGTETDR